MVKRNICLVSAEAVPFVKVGGMADVVGSLYKYLKGKENISLFLPLYKQISEKYNTREMAPLDINFSDSRKELGILHSSTDFPNVFFIAGGNYFGRDELYGEKTGDYSDNAERFSFFVKAVLEAVSHLNINPDIFHCHDWHTALLPLYLKAGYAEALPEAKTLFTIHNLGYQGVFPGEKFNILGLPGEYFQMDELEFYGNINFMKAGIIHSDAINTVSPQYAEEILTPEFGQNLNGLLKKHRHKLSGILNGIDYQIWSPSFDGFINKKYRTYKSKAENKIALQRKLGLDEGKDIPVFGMVSRLVEQKGIDELADILDNMLSEKMQIVILGNGETRYENLLTEWQNKFPGKMSVTLGFKEKLAHQIYAGSDFFLMPSKFEPCGLGQMISFKYGTIPLARNVGGLADTVQNYDFDTEQGSGFTFQGRSPELLECISKALNLFKHKEKMENLVNAVMKKNFSWKESVNKYLSLYREIKL